jgi:hypothetical protein
VLPGVPWQRPGEHIDSFGPLERWKVLGESLAKPVDRAGAVGAKVAVPGGQDAQFGRRLVAAAQRVQVAA